MTRETWEDPQRMGRRWSPRQFFFGLPPLTRGILLATIAAFVVQIVLRLTLGAGDPDPIIRALGLVPEKVLGRSLSLWQPVTYMFLHSLDNPLHIVFNMFILGMFAPEVERALGQKRFGILYFGCGIVAAMVSCVVMILSGEGSIPVIGASGAILGVLAAYGSLFPNRTLRFFMVYPMKAKHFIWLLAGLEVMAAFMGNKDSGVAYITHVAGLAAGFLFIRYRWTLRSTMRRRAMRRTNRVRETDRQIREQVDHLLAKVNSKGIKSLTWRERSFLKRASKRFKKQHT